MTLLQIIGLLLILSPFVAMGIMIIKDLGWKELFQIFGLLALILLVFTSGTILLLHGG